MNNVFLRNKDSINSIIIKYYVALFPLIIYGFYKNGIKLYINNLVGILGLVKPFVFDFVGFFIGVLVNIIYYRFIKKDKIKGIVINSFNPLYGLLIASIVSINTNIYVFAGLVFLCLFLYNLLKIKNLNIIAFTSLIIILITKFIGSDTFLNIYEQNTQLNLNALDYLIGRGYGGINATCVLLLIFSLTVLFKEKSYKKDIAIYAMILYSVFIAIYSVVNNSIGLIFERIFANGVLFSYVFIATDSLSSSYTKKGKVMYSIIISLSTFGLYLIKPSLAALGGITIGSITNNFIDKICQR